MIYDKNLAFKFLQTMLESLNDHQVYLMLAIARKKYDQELVKSSQIVMARQIIKSIGLEPQEKLIKTANAIKDVYFKNNKIPDHAKAIYICLNPADAIKAYFDLTTKTNQYIYDYIANPKLEKTSMKSLDRVWFGCLQANASKGKYIVIDLDNKDRFDEIIEEIRPEWIRWITETRGGYHIILERNNESSKKVFMEMKGIEYLEIARNSMTPVPGTIQGGFKTKKVEI